MSDEELRQVRPGSMTRSYRHGLILVGVLCVLATLAASMLLFQRSYTEGVDRHLANLCRTLAAGYNARQAGDPAALAALADGAGVRCTLIGEDGTVLYDNESPDALPNHGDRPEVQQALADGVASCTRQSATMGRETHYYALRLDTPAGVQVLRVAEEVDNLFGMGAGALPLLVCAVLLILAAAWLLSFWLTRLLVQPINRMAEHLDTIEANVPYEELIPLARTVHTDRKLREDNETMRREFTANVSHELKTPLTSISGYAELIESGMARSTDVPAFAARIHKEAQRMIALVSDILQLSELDSTQAARGQQSSFEPAPVDLAALLKEVNQNMTVNARKAYVTL